MTATDLFTPDDPLTAQAAPERVNYATGVLLQADDFRDEQTYHRGRLAMALRHLAGFGTIAGLRVTPPATGDNEIELRVEPGIALDRYGRLIEIGGAQCIRLARWFAAQDTAVLRSAVQRAPRTPLDVAIVVDLFLSARDCGRGKTPSFASGPFDALDALVPARLAEAAQLDLVPRAEGPPADIPAPKNFWPAPGADTGAQLEAVLGSWDTGLSDSLDEELDPLTEHVDGQNLSAALLARIAIPITLAADAPSGTRPLLDLTQRVRVDNSLRPFVFVAGKWLGRAFDAAPLVQP